MHSNFRQSETAASNKWSTKLHSMFTPIIHRVQQKAVPATIGAATHASSGARTVIRVMATLIACKAAVAGVKRPTWRRATTTAAATTATTHPSTIPRLGTHLASRMLHANSHSTYWPATHSKQFTAQHRQHYHGTGTFPEFTSDSSPNTSHPNPDNLLKLY